MPSFDIVSEIDQHELTNAIDQSNREVANRFDFKDSNATFTHQKDSILLTAPSEFQIQQMLEILEGKMAKRGLDIKSMEAGQILSNLAESRCEVKLKQGIDKESAKLITKIIKDAKAKVQASIQGEQVRVTGKKRDDLQETIQLLKQAEVPLPLQFTNFRD